MKSLNLFARWKIIIGIVVMTVSISFAQHESDSLYWHKDSLLDIRIDTFGREHVLKEVQSAIRRAKKYCAQRNSVLTADSVAAWTGWMRWAVILNDRKSLDLIDDLIPLVKSGSRGNWQYHFTYMSMWSSFEGRHRQLGLAQRADLILRHLNQGTPVENVFYEDRMIDLGPEGIPIILDWAKANLAPGMDELDMEIVSEEGLAFPRLYNRFVAVFASMFNSAVEIQRIRNMVNNGDLFEQRLGNDLLQVVDQNQ